MNKKKWELNALFLFHILFYSYSKEVMIMLNLFAKWIQGILRIGGKLGIWNVTEF